jgi:hypothetical protein
LVATFCLRLAAGLMLMLPILSPGQIPPRFYRVHFLTALGLLAVAGLFVGDDAGLTLWLLLATSGVCCLVGSIVWHLDEAPGGRVINWLTPIALTACLVGDAISRRHGSESPLILGDDLLAALVLGSALTAMLMGHSYLIAPAMTISPLMRLLGALAAAVALRIGMACVGLWMWTSSQSASSLGSDVQFWLPVRWLLGLIAPLVLGWMAWETARIRATQSATGILYVVVIVCFLGELTSMLLLERTQFPL